jgi:hypothetical protein
MKDSNLRSSAPKADGLTRLSQSPYSWCSVTESNCQLMITNQLLYHLTNRALVAEDGVEPPTEAYETSEIPFLYSATTWRLVRESNSHKRIDNPL